jgi:hypothetical protein
VAHGRGPGGGVMGVMYTTWRPNYADLEAFAAELGKFRK